ncbi:WG repeat-containing protein [Actinoplanes sp. CA-054009]
MSAPGDFGANVSQHGPAPTDFRPGEYYEPEPSYQPHPDQTITPGRDVADYDRPEPVTAPPYLVADAVPAGPDQYDPSVSPVSSLPADHPLPTGPVAGARTEPISTPPAIDRTSTVPAAAEGLAAGTPAAEALATGTAANEGIAYGPAATEGHAADTAAGAPTTDQPAADQPRGLGWLLSQSGLGAITPLPPPEPLLAMIEQPVAEPEPEEIHPISGAPENQNWFVPPADEDLATDTTAAGYDHPGTPEAENVRPAAPETEDAHPVTSEAKDAPPSAPEAEDAHPVTPRAEDARPAAPETQDAHPVTSETDDPHPAAPEAEDPRPTAPEPEDPRPATPEAQDAHLATSEVEDAHQVTSETEDPRPAAPEAEDAHPITSETEDPRPAAPEAEDAHPATLGAEDARPATSGDERYDVASSWTEHLPVGEAAPLEEPDFYPSPIQHSAGEPQDYEPGTAERDPEPQTAHAADQPEPEPQAFGAVDPEPEEHQVAGYAVEPEAYTYEPAEDLDAYPADESGAHLPAVDHPATEPQDEEPALDQPATESPAFSFGFDQVDAGSAVEPTAFDQPDDDSRADQVDFDRLRAGSEEEPPAVATEPQAHQVEVEIPAEGPQNEEPAVEISAEELQDDQLAVEIPAEGLQDEQPAVEVQEAGTDDDYLAAGEQPVDEPVDHSKLEERQAAESGSAEGSETSAVEPEPEQAESEPVGPSEVWTEQPGEEAAAPHIEFELGPEWARAEEPDAEHAVDELLEVAEAPSAEFGAAESAEGEAVDVELLEPTPEAPAEEPVEEIVDAELVDESRPELVAAAEDVDPEPAELTDAEQTTEPEAAAGAAAEPETDTAAEPETDSAAEPETDSAAEPETDTATGAEAKPEPKAAPSLVAVPRVPAAPIRQRGDKAGPRDRRADPEEVLSAYPWVFDPATLRERIEETDPMGVVIDRLTDKLEYAERDSVRARLLSLRAVAERLLDELDPALEDAEAGLEHARRAGDPVLEATVLGRLAHVRHWRGEYAEADRLYAEASSPELPTRLQAEVHELAGRSAFEQGRYLEAVNHFEIALDLRKGTDPDLIERIELALDTITGLTTEGWGPYPRTDAEIGGGERRVPGPSLFQDENGWGAVDEDGNVVVEPRYDRFATSLATGGTVDGFTAEGLAVVESDGQQGVIDRTGRVVLPLEHAEVRIHPAAFLVADRFGLWGALGRDGAPMVELTHSERADVIEEIERRVPAARPVL